MKLSIIIPTLNEESVLEKNLSFIKKELSAIGCQLSYEIIVADGGSEDMTVEIAKRLADSVCISAAGRGIQMNGGAKISAGEWLLFLHADSVISGAGIREMLKIINSQLRIAGGAFKLKIDSDKTSHKIISSAANMRSKFFNIAYGDQGIFVKRDIFFEIGGLPDIPIMEDVKFAAELKKMGKFVILPEYITVSSRRWDREGVIYCTLRNWILISFYFIGISPYKLRDWYKNHGG